MGVTTGELYNYSQPEGQRWSTVADSQIQRLYHSVAFLTSNAEVGHLCIEKRPARPQVGQVWDCKTLGGTVLCTVTLLEPHISTS